MRYNKYEQKFARIGIIKYKINVKKVVKIMDRIDNLLVAKGLFESRQKAKYAIENKCVYVNEVLVEKSSKTFDENCKIEIKNQVLPFVSRGGLKLDKAIKNFGIILKNKICIDIGASTGGFTDCMLQNGAKKVFAVDVGHGQLDKSLLKNSKVINLEGTNIKEIEAKNLEKVDFISIDVSFISLTNVLDKAHDLLNNEGEIVALIKPQFEAGKEYINKNGVVKNKKIHIKVIEKILSYSNSIGFVVDKIDYSPIKGPAGNIEYLMHFCLNENNVKANYLDIGTLINSVVNEAHEKLNKNSEV